MEELRIAFGPAMGSVPESVWRGTPTVVKKGLLRIRGELGSGYFSAFAQGLTEDLALQDQLTREVLPALRNLRPPLLVVAGENDACISAAKVRQHFVDGLKGNDRGGGAPVEYVELEGCGHVGGAPEHGMGGFLLAAAGPLQPSP